MKLKTRKRAFSVVACLAMICPMAATAAPEIDDTDVATAITKQYWSDHVVDANQVSVDTQRGIATLTGTVDTLLAKERAARIAETVVGVRAIVNRITVRSPVARGDSAVKNSVEQALLADPATDSYELDVTVDDGKVTLAGSTDSWQEKRLAATVAKDVWGVTSVLNDITVDYKTERPDHEIKAEIERRLENDVRVDDYLIDVSVNDANVTLTGSVGSLAEKRRAETDAWVAAVNSVDSSGIQLKWWARDEMRRMSIYAPRKDEAIEQALKDAFVYDPRVSSFDLEVNVTGGTVTLTGVVDNAAAKRAAEQDARNTVGVWRVINHLQVRPQVIPADNELEKRVRKAFSEDPYVNRFDVTVEAYSGWVYLSGDVNNSFEKHRAKTVAERVKGVVEVINTLTYEYDWTWKPDWELKVDIEDQLRWSPYVDANEVTVTVKDGVATLSGTVETWSELGTAETNAWQAGAKDVRNNLTVHYRSYGPYSPLRPNVRSLYADARPPAALYAVTAVRSGG